MKIDNNKCKIILGITGSIAAYKSIDLAKQLINNFYDVKIVLSKSASQFISVLTLKSLFPDNVFEYNATLNSDNEMLHISLAKEADYILIAPTSANTIAKLANGIADDLLSSICLATQAKIIIAPAMNKIMWENIFVQKNIKILKEGKICIVGPDSGIQACGDIGDGRMSEVLDIIKYINSMRDRCGVDNIEEDNVCTSQILKNKKIIITSGPTREKIDPVRFLSNYSSGKMGYALAIVARSMGADVVFISGSANLSSMHGKYIPEYLIPLENDDGVRKIYVESADDMLKAVLSSIDTADIFIGAAAVADYKPEFVSKQKIKKNKEILNLKLIKNIDIISYIRNMYPDVFYVGFAAETHNIKQYGEEKLKEKQLNMIAINDVLCEVSDEGIDKDKCVFNSEYNELHVIMKDGESMHLTKNTKYNIAKQLLEIIFENVK